MAAGCPHVKNVQLAADKSFLNPRAWACMDCGFTDSVWVRSMFMSPYERCGRFFFGCQACLLCNNVACGRNNSRHALKHFLQTKVINPLLSPLILNSGSPSTFCLLQGY